MATGNVLLTNDLITKTALMEFGNNLQLAMTARRDYQALFNTTTGDTIRIRKPTRYKGREGTNLNLEDINSQFTDLVIDKQFGVDVEVTSKQLALELDDFNREVIKPAMITLANKVDQFLYSKTIAFYNFVGTAGVAPATFAVIDQAGALLESFGIPDTDRFCLLKSKDAQPLRSALYNTFNKDFNSDIILRGKMGNLAGFDMASVQNIIRPAVVSSSFGTPLINGVSQSGASLILDGVTANATIYAGATFTIANVNSVNFTSREDTGFLASFVVTADTTADGSGNITLPIDPPITLTGPYQNITALPVNNAAVTFNAQHTLNIAYHREAFTLAFASLPSMPDSGTYQKTMQDKLAGVTIRMSRQYDIHSDKFIMRFDTLCGARCFGEYGTRVLGS